MVSWPLLVEMTCLFFGTGAHYQIPDVLIEPLSPEGFRVSIPDQQGVWMFSFHGKINQQLHGREVGDYHKEVRKANDGRWTYSQPGVKLQPGDTMYYWIEVFHDDGSRIRCYVKLHQVFTFTEIPGCEISPPTTGQYLPTVPTVPSVPTVPIVPTVSTVSTVSIVPTVPTNPTVPTVPIVQTDPTLPDVTAAPIDPTVPTGSSSTTVPNQETVPTPSNTRCNPSQTTASGTHAPKTICSGDLIFGDDFDNLDFKKWEHESTLAGGGNWEFQWDTNNRTNSITENGIFKIKPTLTADDLGEAALSSATLDLNDGSHGDSCTNALFFGCSRTGNPQNILNPIKSARVRTFNSFYFKYGRVEIRAKLPSGDWLWPAIWLLPRTEAYGRWPMSGDIDILQSRGNRDYKQNGTDIGVQHATSTLSWGPEFAQNAFSKTHWATNNPDGFDKEFHKYELVWTPESIAFKIDDRETGRVTPPEGGFWKLGEFDDEENDNPWETGTKMAPFDQEFFINMKLAVGGILFFPDDAINAGGKPWSNKSPKAATDFWDMRNQWLPSWNLGKSEDSFLQVDYIRVYAL